MMDAKTQQLFDGGFCGGNIPKPKGGHKSHESSKMTLSQIFELIGEMALDSYGNFSA